MTGRNEKKLADCRWSGDVVRVPLDLDNLPVNLRETLDNPVRCIHLAWPGLPNYNSDIHLKHNLPQSRAFLQQLVEEGVQDVLVAGTCFEYGMQEGELSEETPVLPDNPYGKAKDLLRREMEQYVEGKDCRFKWARIFYLNGEGQNPNSLFAQLESAIESGHSSFDMSGGEQVRDYLPVSVCVEYLVRIACHPSFSGTVNVCSGKNVKLIELVREYLQKQGGSIRLNLGVYPYPHWEPFRFWGNPEKLHALVGKLS